MEKEKEEEEEKGKENLGEESWRINGLCCLKKNALEAEEECKNTMILGERLENAMSLGEDSWGTLEKKAGEPWNTRWMLENLRAFVGCWRMLEKRALW